MGRIFASSDWHGCLDPAKKVLDFLQPDDKLYFLGDAIDRGDHGFQIMTHLLNDDRVVYMLGNHEQMMLEAVKHMIQYKDEYFIAYSHMDNNWIYGNGGSKTLEDMHYGEGIDLEYLYKRIKEMPNICDYTSKDGKKIILEHAGFTPDKNGELKWEDRHHDPVWDRDHFYDLWTGAEDMYLVHGHTPVQYLKFEYGYLGQGPMSFDELKIKNAWDDPSVHYIPEVIQYCDGHKFDIDMCTIASGRIALLDLDTFETIYFDEEEK